MKRLTAFLLAMMLVFCLFTTGYAGEYGTDYEITLKINTEYQTDMDLKLWVIERANYQILAPARPLAEKLGAEVSWDEEKKQVTFTRDKYSASLVVGAPTGIMNGVEEELKAVADTFDGQTYVPVEFVGEALHYHVIREMYGRFVRLVQKTSAENPNGMFAETKPGTAPLISTYHRPVPTEFEKSNDPNDLLWYTDFEWIDPKELNAKKELDTSNLPHGEVIYTMDDILESTPDGSHNLGWWKKDKIDDPNVPFTDVLRIACTWPPANTVDYIVKPTKRVKEYIGRDEKFLVSFYVRLVDGGHVDTGMGKLYHHIEESYVPTWIKSVSETVEFNDQWKKVYCLATGVENANHLGFTTGFWRQVIEIGGYQIEQLAPDADTSMFDVMNVRVDTLSPYLSKDAPWRAEALERIEKVRKGDFKVVVKDKEGNPVEGAEVELDMFEHEFRFGAVLDTSFYESSIGYVKQYKESLGVNFNAAGAGNATKEAPFMSNPTQAQRKFDDAKNLGIKYFRGHVMWMPTLQTGMDRPWRLYGTDQGENLDWPTFEKYVKNSFNEFMATMTEITELEVANEMSTRVTWDNRFGKYGYPGKTYLHQLFWWADEIRRENNYDYITLCYCGNNAGSELYWRMLDGFAEAKLPFEQLVWQGHSMDFNNDTTGGVRSIGNFQEIYDRFVYEYGKQYSISEYSIYADTQEYQADHTRDVLILNFSHPACVGFNVFWYSDVYSGGKNRGALEGCAPLYDDRFQPKLGLKSWQDMIYNKWWTRDAKATTDADGRGTVRGFYGDYDITIRVNGEVVATDMAAFHKGYENEYVITLQ